MIVAIPPEIDSILQILTQNGYEAYAVGGCVRDSLLGRKPNDWDIATSAKPKETERALTGFRIVETGLRHGTVTVFSAGKPVEVTTFRVDGTYSDGRHPDGVTFTSSLREDLARRDFTINALACSRTGKIIDEFGGRGDLEHRILRCVGRPDLRFQEDGLRILRGLRFASTLGLSVEPQTAESLLKSRSLLDRIAKERIGAEFLNLLCGSSVSSVLTEFREVVAQFIPEIRASFGFSQNNPYHVYDVWGHTVESVARADPEPVLRLTMFLHDLGKPFCYTVGKNGVGHFYGHAEKSFYLAQSILPRLRLNRRTAQTVLLLVRLHDIPLPPDRKILRRRLNRLGERNLRLLLKVRAADTLAKNPAYRGRLDELKNTEELIDRMVKDGECFALSDLSVSGDDLLEAGIPAGPEIGRTLDALLSDVMDGVCENRRDELLHRAKSMRGR